MLEQLLQRDYESLRQVAGLRRSKCGSWRVNSIVRPRSHGGFEEWRPVRARSPPRSEPANSQALRPIAIAAECPLGGIVRQADAAVIEKAGEGRPALEHTVDRLSRGGVTRQPGAVVLHPALQVAHQGLDALVPDGAPALGRRTIDLAFDREALVNAVHRLGRQRRSPQIGQLEELAPVVAPARGFDDTARRQL
jgi:hypothetical protein